MRDTLIAAYLDYRNNYLSVQTWAEHNGLTWAEGEQLLILARCVFDHPPPDA